MFDWSHYLVASAASELKLGRSIGERWPIKHHRKRNAVVFLCHHWLIQWSAVNEPWLCDSMCVCVSSSLSLRSDWMWHGKLRWEYRYSFFPIVILRPPRRVICPSESRDIRFRAGGSMAPPPSCCLEPHAWAVLAAVMVELWFWNATYWAVGCRLAQWTMWKTEAPLAAPVHSRKRLSTKIYGNLFEAKASLHVASAKQNLMSVGVYVPTHCGCLFSTSTDF